MYSRKRLAIWSAANSSSSSLYLVALFKFNLSSFSCLWVNTKADVSRISQSRINERSLASLCASWPPGHKKDCQEDKDRSLKHGRDSMLRTILRNFRSSTPGGRHKWFIKNLSPSCANIDSPPSMQHGKIETESERWSQWWSYDSALLDICQAAVRALWLLFFTSDLAAPPSGHYHFSFDIVWVPGIQFTLWDHVQGLTEPNCWPE